MGEDKITHIKAFKDIDNTAAGFIFNVDRKRYKYFYNTHELEEIEMLNRKKVDWFITLTYYSGNQFFVFYF